MTQKLVFFIFHPPATCVAEYRLDFYINNIGCHRKNGHLYKEESSYVYFEAIKSLEEPARYIKLLFGTSLTITCLDQDDPEGYSINCKGHARSFTESVCATISKLIKQTRDTSHQVLCIARRPEQDIYWGPSGRCFDLPRWRASVPAKSSGIGDIQCVRLS